MVTLGKFLQGSRVRDDEIRIQTRQSTLPATSVASLENPKKFISINNR